MVEIVEAGGRDRLAPAGRPRLDDRVVGCTLQPVEQPACSRPLTQPVRRSNRHHGDESSSCEVRHDGEIAGGVADRPHRLEPAGVGHGSHHRVESSIGVSLLARRDRQLHVAVDGGTEPGAHRPCDLIPSARHIGDTGVADREPRGAGGLEHTRPLRPHVGGSGADPDVGVLEEGDEVAEDACLLGVADLLVDQGGHDVAPRPMGDGDRRSPPTEIGAGRLAGDGDDRGDTVLGGRVAHLLDHGRRQPLPRDTDDERDGGLAATLPCDDDAVGTHPTQRHADIGLDRGPGVRPDPQRAQQRPAGGRRRRHRRHDGLGGTPAGIGLGLDAVGAEQARGLPVGHRQLPVPHGHSPSRRATTYPVARGRTSAATGPEA